jgi:hypothetical protein
MPRVYSADHPVSRLLVRALERKGGQDRHLPLPYIFGTNENEEEA